MNIALWIVQVLLAAEFLFSGVMKFVTPVEEMTKQMPLPGWFLHFIGVAELLGGLGLVLPGLLGKKTFLTPIAAAGLVVIMIGACVITLMIGAGVLVLIPLVTGILGAFIAYGRWRVLPYAARH
ncbi:MAG TPA: DoxX family protein [Candidatus Binatia bacterium]